MILALMICYLVILYLIFNVFKLIKLTFRAQVWSGIVGCVGILALLFVANYYHPQSNDLRVYRAVIGIAARVSGRVLDVPVEPNTPVKKADVLFRIDAAPYQATVEKLEALLAQAEQDVPQLKEAMNAAVAQRQQAENELKRLSQAAKTAAVSQNEVDRARYARDAAVAEASRARMAYESQVHGENTTVARYRAELKSARIALDDCTVRAPEAGVVTYQSLRPGFMVAAGQAVMSFLSSEAPVVTALFDQQALSLVKPGDAMEVAFDAYPGKMFPGKVASISMGTAQGQHAPTGRLMSGDQKYPRSRYFVSVDLGKELLSRLQLPAGAGGAATIYTDHAKPFIALRKVIVRWYTWLNYIVARY